MTSSVPASPIRFCVLTVSDTASTDASYDTSGPEVQRLLTLDNSSVFVCAETKIVPDETSSIRDTVLSWVYKDSVDWIVCTGGTGFGKRDRTPETIEPLLDRHAPGLVHLMLSVSFTKTPMAALSRPVAGNIKDTLIVTLPGSVKAVREIIEVLTSGGVIQHAIELMRGGDGKIVHDSLAEESQSQQHHHRHHHHLHHKTHHHHHGHHGHEIPTPLTPHPSLPVSSRARQSPFPIISFAQALSLIQTHITPLALPPIEHLVDASLRNYILAEDIFSPHDVPSTRTTSVDGYAIRSTDEPGVYTVLTSKTPQGEVLDQQKCVRRVNTGGSIPEGMDTVIMVEDTELVSTHSDSEEKEEKEIRTLVRVPPNSNVRFPGSDVRKGDLVMNKGALISSGGGEVGSLAFVGRKSVKVFGKPKVGILSTGDEVVDLHDEQGAAEGKIVDTNRPSLQAVLEGLGYEVVDLGIVEDTIEAHTNTLTTGLQTCDILLTTGGTSMGPTDLLKPILERPPFNGTIHFGRVAVKPGKPTTFATVSVPDQNAIKPVFALPGNPSSALVTFHIFVLPALRLLASYPPNLISHPLVRITFVGDSPMPLDARTEFHRVVVTWDKERGKLVGRSTGGQRSSRMGSLSSANGLVVLPQLNKDVEGEGEQDKKARKVQIEVGEEVECLLIGEVRMVF
ncbi:molybdenum cofactor biosynthesis protein [Flagelloscypha sp. PMI_526]|nr:molybdenum cofactor biosynthesis protein [Flagelloscypha sp. PMI_526]